ncbi:MAG: FUSC family protein [Francisellaceae bacterium]
MKTWFIKNQFALINAIKTALASLIGYIAGSWLAFFLDEPRMFSWIVITIVVIMAAQPHMGGAISKALSRAWGTVIGVAAGIGIILMFHAHPTIVITAAIILIALSTYFAITLPKYSYIGVLSAVTIAMVALSQQTSVKFAIDRGLEVLLGFVIAIIVIRFIWPIKASNRIHRSFAKSLSDMQKFHANLLTHSLDQAIISDIFDQFSKQLALIEQMNYEISAKKRDDLKQIAYLIRRLYRYICVSYEYIDYYPDKRQRFANDPHFQKLQQHINAILKMLSDGFLMKTSVSMSYFQEYQTLIDDYMKHMKMEASSRHASTLVFATTTLAHTLQMLITLQQKVYIPATIKK